MLFHNRPNVLKKQYNMKYDYIDIQKNKCDRIPERMRNKRKTFYTEGVNYKEHENK